MSDQAILKRMNLCQKFTYTKKNALVWLNLPVGVSLSEDLPPEAIPVVKRAIERWNKSTGLNLFELNLEKPSLFILWRKQNPTNNSLQVAQARLRFYEPLLLRAEIELFEPAHFSFSIEKKSFTPDLEATLIHELGHALGLEHTAFQGTMSFESDLGLANREIDKTSIQAVRCLYE